MYEKYFEKFPTTYYSNNVVVDITKRSSLLTKIYNNPYIFYPYEIDSNERADQLSYRYYDDPYQSWLLYFSNKIVDPYYEWYLNEKEFVDMLILKYGSYETSTQKIKFYRNDWINKENISISYFDALPLNSRKYWEPVYGYSNKIVAYKRLEVDWIVNTNKIFSYQIVSSSTFIKDEICDIEINGKKGKGQVLFFDANNVYLQHLSGYFTDEEYSNGIITGKESKTNVDFISYSEISSNIPLGEEIYWGEVSYFQYETEKNEYNKTLRVIDKDYKQQISDELKTLMNE